MSEKRYYRSEYVYGAEAPVRKYSEPVHREDPEIVRRRKAPLTKEELRKQQREEYAAENRRKAARFGGLYTLFIVTAVAITLFTCVQYISTVNCKNEQAKEITKLQEQLNELKENNDRKQLAIDTSVDFNYIYDIATNDLGMVHADSDHVVTYESGESEYVIQYSDIPAAK